MIFYLKELDTAVHTIEEAVIVIMVLNISPIILWGQLTSLRRYRETGCVTGLGLNMKQVGRITKKKDIIRFSDMMKLSGLSCFNFLPHSRGQAHLPLNAWPHPLFIFITVCYPVPVMNKTRRRNK